jgi:site-specific DNA-methyltransferase (adenine-specific)
MTDNARTYSERSGPYALGDHRLLCGDSTDPADVARLSGEARADCLWTDPPYGVAYEGKTERHLRIS